MAAGQCLMTMTSATLWNNGDERSNGAVLRKLGRTRSGIQTTLSSDFAINRLRKMGC